MMEFNVFIILDFKSNKSNIMNTFTFIFIVVNKKNKSRKLKIFKKIFERKFMMDQNQKKPLIVARNQMIKDMFENEVKVLFDKYDDQKIEEARKNAITVYDDPEPEYTFDQYKIEVKKFLSEEANKEFEFYCSRRDEFIKKYPNEWIMIKNEKVIFHDKNEIIVAKYFLDNDIKDCFTVCPGQELKVYHI